MRLTLTPRLHRFVRALPQGGPVAWVEIALVVMLAVQLARLVFVAVTPVGPFGDWRPRPVAAMGAQARAALFARFDPFFRTTVDTGQTAVTSLSLKLFGVRLNEASGGGSAIIATPDGIQSSIAVGGEVVPGVVLKAVTIDHIVITRGGTDESLFLDQSQPAPVVQPSGTVPASPTPGAPPPVVASPLQSQVGFEPRVVDGRFAGLGVSPRGDGNAFRAAGFRDGDVVVSVDGRPLGSIADVQALDARMRPGAQMSMTVERGGQRVPLTVAVPAR